MDRYIVREPKVAAAAADSSQGNQMITFSPGMTLENMFFGGYGAEYPNMQRQGFMGMTHVNASPYAPNPANGQMMSGIDPRYLAAYNAESNSAFIAGQRQQMERERAPATPTRNHQFVTDYRNNFPAAEPRHTGETFSPHVAAPMAQSMAPSPVAPRSSGPMVPMKRKIATKENTFTGNAPMDVNNNAIVGVSQPRSSASSVAAVTKQPTPETDVLKKEHSNQPLTRLDKLKALQRSGPRVFSGPVEKVVKWHKALQDIGVLVLYEIVGKCVNIRPGERCAKNLVVRDDNGPAMQVVYYEIDFMLPEVKPPCTVRVIGRMMPGTCRLQAFSVRPATSDDVATLSRRAAVAAHHVGKLCKEYGPNAV